MPITYDPLPKTFDEAFDRIYLNLDASEKALIRQYDTAALIHFTTGMALRNAWNLWGTQPGVSTELKEDFIKRFKLGHADDMSAILLDAVFSKVKGDPFDYPAEVQKYHTHWAKQGVDPVTMQPVGSRSGAGAGSGSAVPL